VVAIGIVSLFVVFSTIYPQQFGETTGPAAGLALSYVIQLTGLFQVCVRSSVETESNFTSVERINEYITDCQPEEEQDEDHGKLSVSQNWPQEGALSFQSASLRYRENLPLVLKSLSLEIKSREKIGVVGRTGSG